MLENIKTSYPNNEQTWENIGHDHIIVYIYIHVHSHTYPVPIKTEMLVEILVWN